MKRFIVKHHEGLSILALCSLFIVADAEPHVMLAWSPVPIILGSLSAIGKRINKRSESEEL